MPAIEPSQPLVYIAKDDVNLPSTGQPNKAIPTNTLQTTGYDKEQVVFGEHLNYILNNHPEWINYNHERIEELIIKLEEVEALALAGL